MSDIYLNSFGLLVFNLLFAAPSGLLVETTNDHAAFRHVLTRENIRILERDILTEGGDPARELMAVFLVASSAEDFLHHLRNAASGKSWNSGAAFYKIVSSDHQEWITHLEYDLPWPLNNHDAVLKHTLRYEAQQLAVEIESVDGIVPVRKGVDRMEQVKGRWVVKNLGSSRIEVSYLISSKPSPLPRLITDPFVHYHVVRSMSTLRQQLEEREI